MKTPPVWSRRQLSEDAATAVEIFRAGRLDEPLELYRRFFETFAVLFRELIDTLDLVPAEAIDGDFLAGVVAQEDRRTAFRYLAAPPVSDDDLKTLAETKLSAAALRGDPEQARRVRDVVLHVLDPYRFPWVREKRRPTAEERERAVVASAALVAARKVETRRRMDPSKVQEAAVKDLLRRIRLVEERPRDIPMVDDAPKPGAFCGESKFGDTRADVVVRLFDRRVMPIECKASNSRVNSFKRLIHEAGGKSKKWLGAFGDRQTVPAVMLSGVFSEPNLETAQDGGLALFWMHRLDDLAEFVEATRG